MKDLKSNLQEKIAFLKLKTGDSEAFVFFYDKYVSNIYRFVLIKVSDKQVAEDLTQDIFLRTWQHLVDKKNIKNFQAFIFRIARNAVIDHYRSSHKQELPLEYISESNRLHDDGKKLDQSLDADEILKQLSKLKPEYQEILMLRYVEDLSINSISEILEKDKNTIRVMLHRATSKLKEITNK